MDNISRLDRVTWAGLLEHSTAEEGKSGFVDGIAYLIPLHWDVHRGVGVRKRLFDQVERSVDRIDIIGEDEFMILDGIQGGDVGGAFIGEDLFGGLGDVYVGLLGNGKADEVCYIHFFDEFTGSSGRGETIE